MTRLAVVCLACCISWGSALETTYRAIRASKRSVDIIAIKQKNGS